MKYQNKTHLANFLEKAKEKHKREYDYSKIDYKNSREKVEIVCKDHGSFFQAPCNHLKGSGCPLCANKKRNSKKKLNKNSFIKKAKEKHGEKYVYPDQEILDSYSDVRIVCENHGEFIQRANHHLAGSGCPKCGDKKSRKKLSPKEVLNRFALVHGKKYDYSKIIYEGFEEDVEIVCEKHGAFWQSPHNHLQGKGCVHCSLKESSPEREIQKILNELNIGYKKNDRLTLKGKELDFLTDRNIAIECNGIYWHSELAGKSPKYHIDKTLKCASKGIRLIHILDRELINKNKIVLSRLKSIFGKGKIRIGARKCEILEIDKEVKKSFLNKYHLQGNDASSVRLGLFYRKRLLSVMTFGKKRIALGHKNPNKNDWELIRYSGNNSTTIIGGASKLLKFFERKYSPHSIISYADARWSEGDLYEKLGFSKVRWSAPNFWYFKNGDEKIYHRFGFRKSVQSKRLKKFDSNLSGWENMKNNGWNRIWDCGNLVFLKNVG